ncbi:MAG: Rrf2 family transcriptional regulator [Sphingomonadales bacterium]|nr:Rrf2 family transcriptional regulator [Sphingomonadales bacterium]MDE2171878.1 Rrf2 family transcriptional regulator [Sphingomonadales bacterium]
MRLSSMADYAVVAMTVAARHGCPMVGADGRRPSMNAALLAEESGLPAPTVQKLVSRLVAAGLLSTTRGAGGGLKLARAASEISLAQIIEAVEGPIAMTPCVDKGRADCSLEQGCAVRPHWPVVNEALRGALASVSLSRLAGLNDTMQETKSMELSE